MKKISLLLGSGISIPAGLPGTLEITNEILCQWNKWYKCDSQYQQKANSGQSKEYSDNSPYSDYPRKVAYFLNLINKEIIQYYGYVAKVDIVQNYEEIYDFVYHIKQALTRNIDNPLTNRIIQSLVHSIEPIFPRNQDKYQELILLCDESMQYMKNVIYAKLTKKPCFIDYLGIISKLVSQKKLKSIFTLNHDNIMESFLRKNAIEYYDGFDQKEENGVRFWKPDFQENQDKLQFLKLHGSIDWFNFRTDDRASLNIEKVGVLEKWNSEDEVRVKINGKEYRVDKFPIFLTGTNDKYLEYNYGLYLELFYHFHRLLNETDVLIIAGYGFGDNAVNLRIIDWMNNESHRLEIITPNVEGTIKNARGAIYSRLQNWGNDRVNFIEKVIQEVKIEDFEF